MPYNPQTQYRGDVYLSRGIEDAGRGLAGAIQNFRRDKAESDFLDEQVVGLAAAAKPLVDAGELDPSLVEDLSKFPGQSLAKKRGIAARALFEVQNARAMRQEKQQTQDLNLRRGMEKARLDMEAARFNQASAEQARARAGQERFNLGLSEYINTPELLRRPLSEAAPGIAAAAGVATPEMLGRLDEARLRNAELNIRDRAVGVQERNAEVGQGKLDLAEAGSEKLKPGERERLINAIVLRLSDPLRPPDEATDAMLRNRLKELGGEVPSSTGGDTATSGAQYGGRVLMVSPDGRRGTVPANQVEAALKKGYKRAGN